MASTCEPIFDTLGFIASPELNPVKSRVLLQKALLVTKDPAQTQRMFTAC